MPVRTALLALPLLAACVPDGPAPDPVPAAAPLGPIAAAEQGCLAAVSQAAGGAPTTIVNSDFSEAGITFQIGAGPANALWRCIGYSDGTTADVAPLA